jgi:hypothetical protein
MIDGGNTEAAAYAFAALAFVGAFIVHVRRRRRLVVTSLCIAAFTLICLLATAWRGVWRTQELWGVGALIAFLMFFAAAMVAAALVRAAISLWQRSGT